MQISKNSPYQPKSTRQLEILIVLFILFCYTNLYNRAFGQSHYGIPKDTSWKHMTIKEKIGQLVIANFSDTVFEKKNIDQYLYNYPVGCFFLSHTPANKRDERLEHIIKISKYPVLFVGDNEAGAGNNFEDLTQFTNLMGLGATASPKLSYDYAKATALESKSIGIKWILSPVIDINMNPFNPIINVRSFGDDVGSIYPLSKNYIAGLQDNDVAACAKHFPGDGVDFRDQHLITSSNNLSKHAWFDNYGKIYKRTINDGVYTIMAGHISLPFYQKHKIEGFYPPASLSEELLKGLLRKKLHFNGVIVSDALIMGGFIKWYNTQNEREIACFKAGCDMLLWPNIPSFFEGMLLKIQQGEISVKDIDQSVERVWWLKEKLGIIKQKQPFTYRLSEDDVNFINSTNKSVSEQSISLRQDIHKLLPFKSHEKKKILVVKISPQSGDVFRYFTDALRKKGMIVDTVRNTYKKVFKPDSYDYIIYAVSRLTHKPVGNLNFQGEEASEGIWNSLAEGKDKTNVISFGSPYFFKEYFERSNIYIDAYSPAPSVQLAVVDALFGRIPFHGKSPVQDNRIEKFNRK